MHRQLDIFKYDKPRYNTFDTLLDFADKLVTWGIEMVFLDVFSLEPSEFKLCIRYKESEEKTVELYFSEKIYRKNALLLVKLEPMFLEIEEQTGLNVLKRLKADKDVGWHFKDERIIYGRD